jgi:type I restriction enzyme, S subunit
MKAAWQVKPFEDCIEKVTYTAKIQRKDFLDKGEFPIVSQEESFINGYWDDAADVFHVQTPVVVFGDHTKVLKFIDFDFVLGADGVKLLPPKTFLLPKFFYYQLQSVNLDSLGYARHYRLLRELEIRYPSLPEQQRIVTLLDEAFEGIATARANAEQNLQNARAIFESRLQAVFTQRGDGWMVKRLEEIGATQTGTTPKPSERSNYGGFIPFVKPGNFQADGSLDYAGDGLSELGASASRKVAADSVLMVCIGATIGKCGYSDQVVTTNQQINAFTPNAGVNHKFVYYQMVTEDFQRRVIHSSGQATLPIINKSKWSALTVALPPTLAEQERLANEFDLLRDETEHLKDVYQRKLAALDALKKSLLHQAFSGQL